MGVFIPVPISELESSTEQSSRTYRLDLNRGRIFSVGSCDDLEAINQFIKKALLTPRFRCLIYDNQYGSELKQTIITADATKEYIETEIPRLIKDACLSDSRIIDIYDFAFSYDVERVFISFKVNTIFGTLAVEEVI